jgi:hypothetical protein
LKGEEDLAKPLLRERLDKLFHALKRSVTAIWASLVDRQREKKPKRTRDEWAAEGARLRPSP